MSLRIKANQYKKEYCIINKDKLKRMLHKHVLYIQQLKIECENNYKLYSIQKRCQELIINMKAIREVFSLIQDDEINTTLVWIIDNLEEIEKNIEYEINHIEVPF